MKIKLIESNYYEGILEIDGIRFCYSTGEETTEEESARASEVLNKLVEEVNSLPSLTLTECYECGRKVIKAEAYCPHCGWYI